MSTLTTSELIRPDTAVADVLRRDPATFGIFEEHGLHFCAGCYIAVTGQIKDGAAFNAIRDVDALVEELNRHFAAADRG